MSRDNGADSKIELKGNSTDRGSEAGRSFMAKPADRTREHTTLAWKKGGKSSQIDFQMQFQTLSPWRERIIYPDMRKRRTKDVALDLH